MKNSLVILFFTLFVISCNPVETEGEYVYNNNCLNCHQEEGKGLGELIPPLTDVNYLNANYGKLPCFIRNGIEGDMIVDGKKFNQPMPAHKDMKVADMVNVLNYILKEYANSDRKYTIKQVQHILDNCEKGK